MNDLAQRESSGNQSAINTLGYLGLYQMGEAALIDAGYIENDGKINNNYSDYQWTGVDDVNSYSDFLNNAQAQTNAVSSYHERVLGYLDSKETTDYIGQTIDGVLITEAGLHTLSFTKYGVVDAEILSISHDAIIDEERGLVFSMLLRLDRSSLLADDRAVEFKPGIAVTAEIQTGERRLI